jgi:uncharacterized protein (TIGR03118 family)
MHFQRQRVTHALGVIASALLVSVLVMAFFVSSASAHSSDKDSYQQDNLVSDQAGVARVTDPNLSNAWGIAFGPKTPVWIADNHTGLSTVYNGAGDPFPIGSPLVVTIPLPAGGTGAAAPTGIVFNSTGDFSVSEGGKSAASLFIFATEDGTISGWNASVDQAHAVLAVDNSASGTVYKGLAEGRDDGHNFLFATNFNSGKVDVYDKDFKWVKSFTDKDVPAGYAPFGITNHNGWLYVTFALQNAEKHDDVNGAGHGFVDIFGTNGHLVKRLISQGALNSPWGLAFAPSDFGLFSHALLVGDFGDGVINAFDAKSGHFLGSLKDKNGNLIAVDGLWGLAFGNGNNAGKRNTLLFTAGPNGENNGLFGTITFKG